MYSYDKRESHIMMLRRPLHPLSSTLVADVVKARINALGGMLMPLTMWNNEPHLCYFIAFLRRSSNVYIREWDEPSSRYRCI